MKTKSESTPYNKLSTLFIVFIVGLILFATNPRIEQFKEFLKAEIKSDANQEGGFSGAVKLVFAAPTAWALGLTTETVDCGLFSLYAVSGINESSLYLGVLNHFFVISRR